MQKPCKHDLTRHRNHKGPQHDQQVEQTQNQEQQYEKEFKGGKNTTHDNMYRRPLLLLFAIITLCTLFIGTGMKRVLSDDETRRYISSPFNHNSYDHDTIRIIGPSYDDRNDDSNYNHYDRDRFSLLKQEQEMLLMLNQHHRKNKGTRKQGSNKSNNIISNNAKVEFHFYTRQEQKQFLKKFGDKCYNNDRKPLSPSSTLSITEQFDRLSYHLSLELWKYCALYIATTTTKRNDYSIETIYWDVEQVQPLISWQDLPKNTNTIIFVPSEDSELSVKKFFAHPGWLQVTTQKKDNLHYFEGSSSSLPWIQEVIEYLMETEHITMSKLASTVALHVQQQQSDTASKTKMFKTKVLEAKCFGLGSDKQNSMVPYHCPYIGFFCCQVWNDSHTLSPIKPELANQGNPSFMLKNPLIPAPPLSKYTTNNGHGSDILPNPPEKKLTPVSNSVSPEIASIYERSIVKITDTDYFDTANFMDILIQNGCLPNTKECFQCLKRSNGGCEYCLNECRCYCRALCNIRPEAKPIAGAFDVFPPEYLSRSDIAGREIRRIPRIIHQTWYENVTKSKYPNMSRLISSWKYSGWKHNFYTDDDMVVFLKEFFPKQVLEAFNALIPGAFRADLFRYCVLLIHGGIYADMDVLLESNLDSIIKPHIGFITPLDDPGRKVQHRSCLWNGFLGVTPGHPIIAKTIQQVVNNIRNRFTSLDYDDMLCPNPILSVSHSMDLLYTTGPCILGATVNTFLGRHPQSHFIAGEYAFEDDEDNTYGKIPGSIVLLQQNKEDMGAHRFTLTDNIYIKSAKEKDFYQDNEDEYDEFLLKNRINNRQHTSTSDDQNDVIVCSTDLPDYDDRPKTVAHYSKSREKSYIYGFTDLYKDNVKAGEEIHFNVINQSNEL